jgi:hypothetical protein
MGVAIMDTLMAGLLHKPRIRVFLALPEACQHASKEMADTMDCLHNQFRHKGFRPWLVAHAPTLTAYRLAAHQMFVTRQPPR